MATAAAQLTPAAGERRFALGMALAMAFVVVAGFSVQLAMGRSTFASPLRVHIHAVVFMGWVALFITQSWLGTRGPMALHRRLGWIGAGWMVLMVVMGFVVTIAKVRQGTVPFFFSPQQFLIGDPISVLIFAGLSGSAIALRRRTDWHARLHLCGMAALIGPGFGRLLPMPLLIPYAFEIASLAGLLFPAIGAIRDWRKRGRIHPAWLVGMAALLGGAVVYDGLAYSPLGGPIYRAVTAGTPGALVAPLEFPPPPSSPLRTGQGD